MRPIVEQCADPVSRDELIERCYEAALDHTRLPGLVAGLLSFLEGDGPAADIEALARHLDRAQRLTVTRDPIDLLPVPAMRVDATGQVIGLNAEAAPLLSQATHPVGSGRALGANAAQRRQLVAQMAGLSVMSPHRATFIITSAGDHLHLHVMDTGTIDERTFLVLVIATWLPVRFSEQVERTFNLTPAEARLCVTLAAGRSLDDMAALFHVSKNTVRTQLRAAFDKTGTHSQAELVARVMGCIFTMAHAVAAMPRRAIEPYPTPVQVPVGAGHQLGCREFGDPHGRPVLVLHGFADTGLQRPQEDAIARAQGLRLICPDRPGMGRSAPLADPSPVNYAQCLVGLARTLGIDRPVVVGLSYGALDALLAARQLGAPRAVLVSPNFPEYEAPAELSYLGAGFASMLGALRRSDRLLDALFTILLKVVQRQGLMFHARHLARTAPVDLALLESSPDLVARIEAGVFESVQQGVGQVRAFMRAHMATPASLWQHHDQPVTLWHGAEDADTPLVRVRACTAGFARVEINVVPDAGHRLYYQHFDRIAADLAAR